MNINPWWWLNELLPPCWKPCRNENNLSLNLTSVPNDFFFNVHILINSPKSTRKEVERNNETEINFTVSMATVKLPYTSTKESL